MLGEFGDDPRRYASAKARKNYAATSPITRQSGKKKTVHGPVHPQRPAPSTPSHGQACARPAASPGARAYYDQLRARGLGHNAALRQLANRLVGILHGCLKTRTLYDEATAWSHRVKLPGAARQIKSRDVSRALRSEDKGQAGACPDRTRAIPCKVRAVTG